MKTGEHTLFVKAIDTAGNTFETVGITVTVTQPSTDITPPTIEAALLNDTGESNSDRLTNDVSITGIINENSQLSEFKAGIDGNTPSFDVLGDLNNGNFSFDLAKLETINGKNLSDGKHTLKMTTALISQ